MNKILKTMNKDIDKYYQDQKDTIKKQYSFYKVYSIKKPALVSICISLLLIFNIYQYQTDLKPITKTITEDKKNNNQDKQKHASIKNKTKKEITIYQKQDKYINNTYILITINIIVIIYIIYKETNKT